MTESKSVALPAWLYPKEVVGKGGFEPPKVSQQIYSLSHLASLLLTHFLKVVDAERFELPTSAV